MNINNDGDDQAVAPPPPPDALILDPTYNWTHASRMLQCMIEEMRQYFSRYHLARLVFQVFFDQGMTFYRVDHESFVLASQDQVIELIGNALVVGYDNAVQAFHNNYATAPSAHGPQAPDWGQGLDTTTNPSSFAALGHHASSRAITPVPHCALILDPQYSQLSTSTVLRYVTDQVRQVYMTPVNRVNLALQLAAQRGISSYYSTTADNDATATTFSQVPDYQVRAFFEQALAHGYHAALQEFRDSARQVEAAVNNAASLVPGINDDDDTNSLGSFLEGMEWGNLM